MSELKLLAIDLAKNIFELYGVDRLGKQVLSKTVRRSLLLALVARLPRCTIVTEACGSAHHWGRQFAKLGHEVKLIPPQYVRAFRQGNKTDRNDALAICEAAQRPTMRFVALKSEEQQAVMAAQKLRSLLVKARTALSNHTRGQLAEFGVSFPQGLTKLRAALNDAQLLKGLPTLLQEVLKQAGEQLRDYDGQILDAETRLRQLANNSAVCRYLMKRRGIGVLTALALHSQIDPAQFKNGRHLSASLGLVPMQHSTGGKQRLMSISKRGNVELRTLLVHCARSVVQAAKGKNDPLSKWITQLKARRGINKTIVAMANKLARYAWVDLRDARNEAAC